MVVIYNVNHFTDIHSKVKAKNPILFNMGRNLISQHIKNEPNEFKSLYHNSKSLKRSLRIPDLFDLKNRSKREFTFPTKGLSPETICQLIIESKDDFVVDLDIHIEDEEIDVFKVNDYRNYRSMLLKVQENIADILLPYKIEPTRKELSILDILLRENSGIDTILLNFAEQNYRSYYNKNYSYGETVLSSLLPRVFDVVKKSSAWKTKKIIFCFFYIQNELLKIIKPYKLETESINKTIENKNTGIFFVRKTKQNGPSILCTPYND